MAVPRHGCVRMAQSFTFAIRSSMVRGTWVQIDSNSPATMRYTRPAFARSTKLLLDIEKETVEWIDNFKGTLKEPLLLPSKVPNVLVRRLRRCSGRHGDQNAP